MNEHSGRELTQAFLARIAERRGQTVAELERIASESMPEARGDVCRRCGGAGFYTTEEDAEAAIRAGRGGFVVIKSHPCPCQDPARKMARMARFERRSSRSAAMLATARRAAATGPLVPKLQLLRPRAHLEAFRKNGLALMTLAGKPGRGKSLLAVLWCHKQIDKGDEALFKTAPEALSALKATFGADDKVGPDGRTYDELWDELVSVDSLALDDVGTGSEMRTEWGRETLHALVAARYEAGRPTLITTNKHPGDFEERLASRLLDRERSRWALMRTLEGDDEDVRAEGAEPDPLPNWDLPDPLPTTGTITAAHRLGAQGRQVLCHACDGRPCFPECPLQMVPDPHLGREIAPLTVSGLGGGR